MATIDSLTTKATPLTTDTIELGDGKKATLGSLPVSTAQATADAAIGTAAASDATTKANAAQVAAIAAAATDATTKVANEATDRANADATLGNAITAETAARVAGDAVSLNSRASRQALVFDGTAGCLLASPIPAFATSDFTLAFIGRNGNPGTAGAVYGGTNAPQTYLTGNGKFGLAANGGVVEVDVDPTILAHYAITRASGVLRFYRNGVQLGANIPSVDEYAGGLGYIGVFGAINGQFTGELSALNAYSYALTAAEVARLFATGAPDAGDSGLLLWPDPLQPGIGTQWRDVSGNGAHINLPGDGITGGVVWALPDGGTLIPLTQKGAASGVAELDESSKVPIAQIPTDGLTIRFRRGTDADRQLITPLQGEGIYTTDLDQFWIGDGTTAGGRLMSPISVLPPSGAVETAGPALFVLQAASGSVTGNARGAGSIDFQFWRAAATDVATGTGSALLATTACGVSQSYTLVAGAYESRADSTFFGGIVTGGCASSRFHNTLTLGAGKWDAAGDAQAILTPLRAQSTTNTLVFMTPTGLSSTSFLPVTTGRLISGILQVTGAKTDGSKVAHYQRKVVVKNVAGTVSIVLNETVGTDYEDDATWDLQIAISSASGGTMRFRVMGGSGETVRWTGSFVGQEVKFA